jgi:hypothetical protein
MLSITPIWYMYIQWLYLFVILHLPPAVRMVRVKSKCPMIGWSIYIYVYIYTYIYLYIHIYIHLTDRSLLSTVVLNLEEKLLLQHIVRYNHRIFIYIYANLCIYTYICIFEWMSAYIYIRIFIHVCIHIYTFIYIYMYKTTITESF